jgi:hypothetical protein
LRQGYELVMGCRLPSGGGSVASGAMPMLHRWLGNPLFSAMVRGMYRAPIHDVYCGLRGFTRQLYDRLALRCTGMEFATEMVIKSSLFGVRIAEIPITLHPDGRKAHAPHLKTFTDGWRTLRFFMLYSPRWLFFAPGVLSVVFGLVAWILVFAHVTLGNIVFDAHTMLFGNLFIILGYQSMLFGVMTKVFAMSERLLPDDPRIAAVMRIVTLERCLVVAALVLVTGVTLLLNAVGQWRSAGFGALDYSTTMRWAIPGITLSALGFQTLLASFFISVLGLRHR